MSTRPLLLAPLLLAACEVTQENFPDRYFEIQCDRTRECYRAYFEQNYDDDAQECVETYQDAWDNFEDIYEACNFDEDAAAECLEAWRSESCESLFFDDGAAPCTEVCDF